MDNQHISYETLAVALAKLLCDAPDTWNKEAGITAMNALKSAATNPAILPATAARMNQIAEAGLAWSAAAAPNAKNKVHSDLLDARTAVQEAMNRYTATLAEYTAITYPQKPLGEVLETVEAAASAVVDEAFQSAGWIPAEIEDADEPVTIMDGHIVPVATRKAEAGTHDGPAERYAGPGIVDDYNDAALAPQTPKP